MLIVKLLTKSNKNTSSEQSFGCFLMFYQSFDCFHKIVSISKCSGVHSTALFCSVPFYSTQHYQTWTMSGTNTPTSNASVNRIIIKADETVKKSHWAMLACSQNKGSRNEWTGPCRVGAAHDGDNFRLLPEHLVKIWSLISQVLTQLDDTEGLSWDAVLWSERKSIWNTHCTQVLY